MKIPVFNFNTHQVHAWVGKISALRNLHLLENIYLSLEEETRKQRFATDPLRQNFFYSHAILRVLLGRYLHICPNEIMYRYGMHQKPFIQLKRRRERRQREAFTFNMSHSKDCFAYAFSSLDAIGIDIEECGREVASLENLSDYICHEKEKNRQQATICLEEKKMHFFRLWTAKEAFLKMLGRGLGDHLPSIYVDENSNVFLPERKLFQENSFVVTGKIDHFMNSQYVASVASQQSISIIWHELQDIGEVFLNPRYTCLK